MIPNHLLLAKVERLEARLERLERLEISSSDLEEHLARLKRLEGFMECIESYLDRLERLSGPLARLEERLDLMEGRSPSSKTDQRPQLVQAKKVKVRTFLSQLGRSTATPQPDFSFKALRKWFLRSLGRR
ncbi:MAG: hypothetical protein TH68_05285 [Candidatus Synechococcus spongiarum 142]|uniref:Uncharacterized protein n=1 Tax=Candidatus Synechococcus spongiarum 142 TaxID=1608213 RepID=A0A6N3X8H4_9SYNE|nr:MAG: hypothetical protein TH68_05285 [Candidatus Synechococcus spongiarum 142]